jgi:hypothetical protein
MCDRRHDKWHLDADIDASLRVVIEDAEIAYDACAVAFYCNAIAHSVRQLRQHSLSNGKDGIRVRLALSFSKLSRPFFIVEGEGEGERDCVWREASKREGEDEDPLLYRSVMASF